MGLERALAGELSEHGIGRGRIHRGGASVIATLPDALRAAMWLRTAQRVLLEVADFPVYDADSLYDGVYSVPWEDWMDSRTTFAVYATGTTRELTHTHFTALKAKDALCDRLRDCYGSRPDVDTDQPAVRIAVHVGPKRGKVALDLVGTSLHQRGYRVRQTEAPMKETLAAAMVLSSGWDRAMPLVDPMCGSGTLLIEAASIAMRRAPGIDLRPAALEWRPVSALARKAWSRLQREAREVARATCPAVILGGDVDPRAIEAARVNADKAGLGDQIDLRCCDLAALPFPQGPGVVVTNAPYGARIGGAAAETGAILDALGATLAEHPDFSLWLLTDRANAAKRIGRSAKADLDVRNGPIECRLLGFSALV
jgi:putative N6-adenine-specific DNA methylase